MKVKDKAKSEYRGKTLKLINELDELMQKLKLTIQPYSLGSHGEMHCGHPEGPHDGEILQTWYFRWNIASEHAENNRFYGVLDELNQTINSVMGAKMYPRGMYRELLEFSDKCSDVLDKWVQEMYANAQVVVPTFDPNESDDDRWSDAPTNDDMQRVAEFALNTMKRSFQKDVKSIRRSILLFENERNETEESFIEE